MALKKSPRKDAGTAGKSKTRAEAAYEQIKERLISARYVPGQFLQESQVCSDLGMGRTPVYQALHRLQQESLIEIIPRKGILVKADSLSEIMQALDVRLLLEPYCAAQCAAKATDSDIKALRRILQDYDKRKDGSDKARMMEADRQFHIKIAEIAGNTLMADFLRTIHERMSRIWFLPHWQFHDFGMTGDEHADILGPIERHDSDAAREAMHAHIESIHRRIMAAGP